MRRASRAFGYSLLGLLAAVAMEACGSSNPPRDGGPPAGRGGGSGLGNMDATTVDAPSEGGMGGTPFGDFDPLCGVTQPGGCVPDRVNSCASTMGGASGRGAGGASSGTSGSNGTAGSGNASGTAGALGGAGESSDGGEGGEGGIGQAGSAPQGSGGSSGGANGGAGTTNGGAGTTNGGAGTTNGGAGTTNGGAGTTSGGSGMSGNSGTGSGLPRYACQVGIRRAEPRAACVLAGSGDIDAPCLDGSDCQPGLACVGRVAGRCRPYCCDHSACGSLSGTHCAEEPLLGVPEVAGRAPVVPVCVPAVECSLAEDYPCAGIACTCPDDTACMVVSDEGKTSCVEPGNGAVGDACPCKWGHVCSKTTNECEKLCQTAAPGDDCGSGRCQATAALPVGWGICVGYVPPDGG
jgi:hypothetical protein